MKKALLTALCITLMGFGMAQENHWTPNQTFENTMDGIGIVIINGVEQFTGTLELGVFCGDDCRGSVFAEDEGDHWFYYFSMGGVSGETFTFRLYDHSIQEELDLTCTNEAVPFEVNGFLGDWDAPYEIVFEGNTTVSYTLPIIGYGTSTGGYYLIAPPVDNVDPAAIEGMTSGNFDLYYFDQAQDNEWINYKSGTFTLASGKGYLYANQADVTLEFTGTPYSGDGKVTLNKTNGVALEGWNLVGNPFNKVACIVDGRPFYTMNTDGSEIVPATSSSIEPMEGVFVIAASDNEEMTFVPQDNPDESGKIVLNIQKDRGVTIDRAIVRLEGNGMLPKFMLNQDNTKIYIPQNGTNYAVVTFGDDNTMPVCFKAKENGSYTLHAEIVNLDVEYLHLIDNLTGADIDLLASPVYTFEANTTDFSERFKLVYAATTGVDEENTPFAFIDGTDIVVVVPCNEDALLQVFDITGRPVVSGNATQRVSIKGLPTGVYVFRLINGNEISFYKTVVN